VSVTDLPIVNALLNATSAVLLTVGWVLIRQRAVAAHRACMVAAFVVSVVFLVCYLVYHYAVGSVRFPGTGVARGVYLTILASHTILAVAVPPLALIALYRAWKGHFAQHRRIARWALPVWLYVSVTGVVIYVLLYQVYGARPPTS